VANTSSGELRIPSVSCWPRLGLIDVSRKAPSVTRTASKRYGRVSRTPHVSELVVDDGERGLVVLVTAEPVSPTLALLLLFADRDPSRSAGRATAARVRPRGRNSRR
jgi:hypothetical protein